MPLFTETLENLPKKECKATESESTLSRVDFLVSLTAWLVSALHKMTNATFGESAKEYFAKFSPDGQLLKMSQGFCQVTLDGSFEEFSGALPRQGMMRAGLLMRLPMLGRRKDGNGCLSWPTATSRDWKDGSAKSCENVPVNGLLGRAVHHWPTPKGCPSGPDFARINREGSGGDDLATIVAKMWATPSAADSQGSHGGGQTRSLRTDVHGQGGQLNADWVEILMGYDIGVTDIDCDEPEPWPGWPAGRGAQQYPYEPSRVIVGQKNRSKRLKCLGNSVVPAQAYPIFAAIMEIETRKEAAK